MNTNAIQSRLKQIFAVHSHEEICEFVEAYAYDNQSLALALIDAFGTFDPGDAKALVEQCFIHPATTHRLGTSLNWYAIGEDLGKVLEKARQSRQQGDDLGAALIVRYMLTMTWQEYMEDHPNLELSRGDGSNLHVQEVLDMLRELLIERDTIDFDTRKGLLKEIVEETKPIRKKDWLGRLDWFLDDAKAITMTRKGYVSFLKRKISSAHGAFRWDYVEKLMRYYLSNNEVGEAHSLIKIHGDSGAARVALIDYLTNHQQYDEAIQVSLDVKDAFSRYSFKLDEKVIDILHREGDNDKLIHLCRRRFLEAEYRWPYYEALKDAIPANEWKAFLQQLLSECDFEMDCDSTQVRLYKAEGLHHLYFPFFMNDSRIDIRYWKDYGGLMTEEEQKQVGEKLSQNIIEMAKRLNNRRDYRIIAEYVSDFKKASPLANKMGNKLVERILDAAPGRPALYDELVKKDFSH